MSKQASMFVICVLPGWLFGDPHIRSADGFRYTFNGLGEYTLLQADEATLQGMTAQARREDGRQTNATVFSAFAAKDTRSGRVHVALNESRDGNISYCVFRTKSVDVFCSTWFLTMIVFILLIRWVRQIQRAYAPSMCLIMEVHNNDFQKKDLP